MNTWECCGGPVSPPDHTDACVYHYHIFTAPAGTARKCVVCSFTENEV